MCGWMPGGLKCASHQCVCVVFVQQCIFNDFVTQRSRSTVVAIGRDKKRSVVHDLSLPAAVDRIARRTTGAAHTITLSYGVALSDKDFIYTKKQGWEVNVAVFREKL